MKNKQRLAAGAVRCAILLAAVPGFRCALPAQAGDAGAVVEDFCPHRLLDLSMAAAAGRKPPERSSAFVAADLNGTGRREFLVAAYSSGMSAAVRVLRQHGATAVLVDEPDLPCFGGRNPAVSLLDLDGDGRPEVVVKLGTIGCTSMDWIFKWKGSKLTPYGATVADDNGCPASVLHDASFVDLDGDGVLEIVNPPELNVPAIEAGRPGQYTVFKLKGGSYTLTDGTLDHFSPCFRGATEPSVCTQTFAAASPGRYGMTIVNGNGGQWGAVSSVEVQLNGELVPAPGSIAREGAEARIPVNVQLNNSIKVTVAGARGSGVVIAIGPERR